MIVTSLSKAHLMECIGKVNDKLKQVPHPASVKAKENANSTVIDFKRGIIKNYFEKQTWKEEFDEYMRSLDWQEPDSFDYEEN